MTPNREVFEQVCRDIDSGIPLNMSMIGDVFGQPFWEILVLCLIDSKNTIAVLDYIKEKNAITN